MRYAQLGLLRSGLGTGILVVALFFQMLPFMLLLVVISHALGVSGGVMLIIIPVCFFAMVFASCWLAAKRAQQFPNRGFSNREFPRPPPRSRPTSTKPPRNSDVVLMKTRAERYQDLRNALGNLWR